MNSKEQKEDNLKTLQIYHLVSIWNWDYLMSITQKQPEECRKLGMAQGKMKKCCQEENISTSGIQLRDESETVAKKWLALHGEKKDRGTAPKLLLVWE